MDGTNPFKIILGSSSITRKKLLTEMGYDFTVMSADIDEKAIRKEKPDELVLALADAKVDAIISKIQTADKEVKNPKQTVLTASHTAQTMIRKISSGMDGETTILVTCDQAGNIDSVMGMPMELTKKLFQEALKPENRSSH